MRVIILIKLSLFYFYYKTQQHFSNPFLLLLKTQFTQIHMEQISRRNLLKSGVALSSAMVIPAEKNITNIPKSNFDFIFAPL